MLRVVNMPLTLVIDEYTALQKYISTYRDPKTVDPDAPDANAKDAGKGKAWWQVRVKHGLPLHRIHS